MIELLDIPLWARIALFVAYLIANEGIEYWLGKTNRVQASSKLELLINVISSLTKKP